MEVTLKVVIVRPCVVRPPVIKAWVVKLCCLPKRRSAISPNLPPHIQVCIKSALAAMWFDIFIAAVQELCHSCFIWRPASWHICVTYANNHVGVKFPKACLQKLTNLFHARSEKSIGERRRQLRAAVGVKY